MNALIKVINIILLIIFGLGMAFNGGDVIEIKLNIFVWIIIFSLSPFLSTLIIYLIKSKHEFCEWDKKEREKKDSFISVMTMTVFFFTFLSIFFISTSIVDYSNIQISTLGKPEIIILALRFVYGILFLLNSIFTVQLHNIYSNYLLLDRSVAQKPSNWDRERTIHDDISDFENGM